jgi:hypothetical protein
MGSLCKKLKKKRQEVLGGGKEDGEHSEWLVFGRVFALFLQLLGELLIFFHCASVLLSCCVMS